MKTDFSSGFENISLMDLCLSKQMVQTRNVMGSQSVTVYEDGRTSNQKLLFLSDFSLVIHHYSSLLKQLTNNFRVVAFDWPGQGRSDCEKDYNLETIQNYVSALLESLCWNNSRFHVLAHGTGCTIALSLFGHSESQFRRSCMSLTLMNPMILNINPIILPKKSSISCCVAPLNDFYNSEVQRRNSQEISKFSSQALIYIYNQASEDWEKVLQQDESLQESNNDRLQQYLQYICIPHPEFLQKLQKNADLLKILFIQAKADIWITSPPKYGDFETLIEDGGHMLPLLRPKWVCELMASRYCTTSNGIYSQSLKTMNLESVL